MEVEDGFFLEVGKVAIAIVFEAIQVKDTLDYSLKDRHDIVLEHIPILYKGLLYLACLAVGQFILMQVAPVEYEHKLLNPRVDDGHDGLVHFAVLGLVEVLGWVVVTDEGFEAGLLLHPAFHHLLYYENALLLPALVEWVQLLLTQHQLQLLLLYPLHFLLPLTLLILSLFLPALLLLPLRLNLHPLLPLLTHFSEVYQLLVVLTVFYLYVRLQSILKFAQMCQQRLVLRNRLVVYCEKVQHPLLVRHWK